MLKVFTNEEFGEIRLITLNKEPMFIGKDLVEKLGYTKKYYDVIKQHCDDDDYLLYDKNSAPGWGSVLDYKILGQRGGYLVNESGMYSLVLGSVLPSAKKFKRWVTKEVLPSIRKTGGYLGNTNEMSDEEIMARALMVAQKTIDNKNKEINDLKKEVKTITTHALNITESKKVINRLVRLIAVNNYNNMFGKAWNELYSSINYNLDINIKARNKKNNESYLDTLIEPEMFRVEEITRAWANDLGIDVENSLKLSV